MKVAFICGSLEIGKDGVGDYTRHLAFELIRQNHHVGIVAFNDQHVSQRVEDFQTEGSACLNILRIPACWSGKRRRTEAKEWIDTFEPQWISLQFVPYAYNYKGLPISLSIQLQSILPGRKLHVMFHEAWVGAPKRILIKGLLTTALQKFVIQRMIDVLKPAVIHTHLPYYKQQFELLGWKVKSLPLFSNIRVTEKRGEDLVPQIFKVAFFSQVDAGAAIISFLKALKRRVEDTGRVVEILFIGGEKTRVKVAGDRLETFDDFRGRVRYSGFLLEEELSFTMQDCSLGVTPIPRHALGKSGSVAAFLAHGVPVAAPNIEEHYSPDEIGFFSSNLKSAIVLNPDLSEIENAAEKLAEAKEEIQLQTIAKRFASDLQRG